MLKINLTNSIKNTREKFLAKELSREEYIDEITNTSRYLFEICDAIEDSPITDIHITSGNITYDVDILGKAVTLASSKRSDNNMVLLFRTLMPEFQEMQLFIDLLDDGDCFFDIGANVGIYSILAMQRKNVTTYSFEPFDETYKMLVESIKSNSLPTNNAYNLAFGDIKGTCDFWVNNDLPGASGLRNNEYTNSVEKVICNIDRLDNFVAENSITKLDFIKCDVEGAEILVLKGGMETIRMFRPLIQLELLRKWAKKYDYHPNDIINMLSNEGYYCYITVDGKFKRFNCVDENTIEKDYFFVHKNSHKWDFFKSNSIE